MAFVVVGNQPRDRGDHGSLIKGVCLWLLGEPAQKLSSIGRPKCW